MVAEVEQDELDPEVLFLLLCLVELLVLFLKAAALVLLDLHLEVEEDHVEDLLLAVQVDLSELV